MKQINKHHKQTQKKKHTVRLFSKRASTWLPDSRIVFEDQRKKKTKHRKQINKCKKKEKEERKIKIGRPREKRRSERGEKRPNTSPGKYLKISFFLAKQSTDIYQVLIDMSVYLCRSRDVMKKELGKSPALVEANQLPLLISFHHLHHLVTPWRKFHLLWEGSNGECVETRHLPDSDRLWSAACCHDSSKITPFKPNKTTKKAEKGR